MKENSPMTHGGDIQSYIEQYGMRPLDFSASISPLGIPEGVKRAAEAALSEPAGYPDPHCRTLRRAIAERLPADEKQIVCTNGASDLIMRLAFLLRGKQVLLPVPMFTEYERAFRLNGCRIRHLALKEENGFALSEELLNSIEPDTDAVILCQPMNPSGTVCKKDLLYAIAERCAEYDVLLAVDECFIDFLNIPGRYSLWGEHSKADLLLIRAFTKLYGMASLRLGYGVSHNIDLIRRLSEAGAFWMVSAPAMAAGIAALKETDYEERLKKLIAEERDYLTDRLQNCGCNVIPSRANYLMFSHQWKDLGKELAQRGILIRTLDDMGAPGWYRAAVLKHSENERLILAMKEVCQ